MKLGGTYQTIHATGIVVYTWMGHLDRVVMFCNYSSPIRLDIWHGQKTEFGTDPSFFPTQEVLDNLHGPFLGGLASEGPRLSMVNLDIPCFFHKNGSVGVPPWSTFFPFGLGVHQRRLHVVGRCRVEEPPTCHVCGAGGAGEADVQGVAWQMHILYIPIETE